MGNLLLGITLILYGINLTTSFLPNLVFAILFIITGILLLIEGRGVIRA